MRHRHEFDWRAVLGVLGEADLSDEVDARRWINRDPHPLWPSDDYKEGHEQLISGLLAPSKPLTVADLERVIDKLFAELAKAEPPSVAVEQRWEKAAISLLEAKRQANQTRRKPSIFEAE